MLKKLLFFTVIFSSMFASSAYAGVDVEVKYILNTFSFLVCGFLVMWMAAGFCMLESGLVTTRSVSTIAAKNIGKFAIVSIVFYIVGYNLAYGIPEGGYIGSLMPWSDASALENCTNENDYCYSDGSDWFFQALFVCATASIPLALLVASPALFESPGGAIALLIAGPATNVSTITTCIKMIGKKSTVIYVSSIFMFALISGVIADNSPFIIDSLPSNMHMDTHSPEMHVSWFSSLSVFALLGVLGFCLLNKKQIKAIPESQKIIIDGMTCSHCESSVEQALLKLENIQSVSANHKKGEIILIGYNYNFDEIQKQIISLNYKIISFNK